MKHVGKDYDFFSKRYIFFAVSIGIVVLGFFFQLFFGIEMGVEFKGGTLIKYNYAGDMDREEIQNFAAGVVGVTGEVQMATVDKQFTLSFAKDLTVEQTNELQQKMAEEVKDNGLERTNISSVNPSMGNLFFLKCLIAIGQASLFLLIFVAVRFRKIGGLSAGAMGLVALLHDCIIAYLAFVVLRIPLDDNFVAVILVILGYSLNDTIIIYDRIRENRRLMDRKTPIREVVNLSINQSFTRSFNTGLCTFIAIGMVAVLGLVFNLDSIVAFAVPMAAGTICGVYSTIFICGPLWVMWTESKEKRRKAKKVKARAGRA